jgi:hypothetical protein
MNAVSLHPWKINFEWIDAEPSGRLFTSSETDAFNRGGFVVLRDALPVSLVDDVRAATDTELQGGPKMSAPTGRASCSQADYQYPVLRRGTVQN